MIPIIIISVFVVIAFGFFIFYLISIIIRKLNKKQIEKSIFIKTALSGVLLAVLGCINIVLIFMVIVNGDPLIDSILNKGADVVSKTLVYTWEGVQQNWNKETLEKIKSIDLTVEETNKVLKDENYLYTVRLLLNNKAGKDQFLSYYDLADQKLIFFTDKDDIFYSAEITEKPANSIPLGKSRLTVIASVSKDIELTTLHFAEKIIDIEKK